MKTRSTMRWVAFLSLLALTALTCNLPSPTFTQPPPQVVVSTVLVTSVFTPIPATPTVVTDTPIPPTVPSEETGPRCTILQDLNFRYGPGEAYIPVIKQLPPNTVLIPIGFNPSGTPGGSWVMVNERSTGQQGWVSAGSQFVSCNVSFATLPFVAGPPPPVVQFPSSVQSSATDGNGFCIDPDSGLQCVVTFSDESLMQFRLFSGGQELTQDFGMEYVIFRVQTLDRDTIYEVEEVTSSYCIFGGNGPCNAWIVDNGAYWWPNGIQVQEGVYHIEIEIGFQGDTSLWLADFIVLLP